MKKILLIGSTGFIGTYFKNELKKKFIVIDTYQKKKINVLNSKILNKIITKKFLFIINLSGQKSQNMSKVNIIGNKNIIDILNKKKLNIDYIFFSSTLLYRYSTKKLNEKSGLQINDRYKKSKYLAEKYIVNFYKSYFIIRLSNVYDDNLGSKGFLANLKKAFFSNQLLYVTNSKTNRNYIHAKDVVQTVLNLIDSKKYGIHNVFNENYSLREIINFFSTISKKKILFIDQKKSLKLENSQKFILTKNKKNIYIPRYSLKKTIKNFYEKNNKQ